MHDQNHSVRAWVRDIAIAYAGGLVLGAPLALLAVWATGVQRLAPPAMLLAMCAVLHALRRTRRASPVTAPVPATPVSARNRSHAA